VDGIDAGAYASKTEGATARLRIQAEDNPMIGVGLVGLGFMGKVHFDVYGKSDRARVVAICDVDEKKLKGDWSSIGGNIGEQSARKVNLHGIRTCSKIEELLADRDVGMVDITLPTHMHAENVVKALRAGKHVLCEKPIALTLEDATEMVKVAGAVRGKFMVAHCIRWWPEYSRVREIVTAKTYGRTYSAIFRRISPTPTWGQKNWLQDHTKSGGACVDLHIHDIDYINYLFGLPQAVTAVGITKTSGGIDHIITRYHYETGNFMVVAEGSWTAHPGTPFEMSFQITCETATIQYSSARAKTLVIYPNGGGEEYPPFDGTDGYQSEINYFLDCIEKNTSPTVVTPAEAREALVVALAEIRSVQSGKTVEIAK
jgi:predicted dehydrogenase